MLKKNRRLALLKVGSCSKSINFGIDSYPCFQGIFCIDTRENIRGQHSYLNSTICIYRTRSWKRYLWQGLVWTPRRRSWCPQMLARETEVRGDWDSSMEAHGFICRTGRL